MGSAACCQTARRPVQIRQQPTIDPQKNQPIIQGNQPPMNATSRPGAHSATKIDQGRSNEPRWPKPPNEHEGKFQPSWPKDSERYSLQKAYNLKVPWASKPAPQAKKKTERDQLVLPKETNMTQWNTANSSIHDSAHVQTTVKTQSHASVNLSRDEDLSKALETLNEIHRQVDENVKARLQFVSEEAEEIVKRITTDTHSVQQGLLEFAKTRQIAQDKIYSEWLQKYIVVLDEWRAGRLAKLQEDLDKSKREIIHYSQRSIATLYDETNKIKARILREEQDAAKSEIESLLAQFQSLQYLGSETMMNINLTIQANVGNRVPGQQNHVFDIPENS